MWLALSYPGTQATHPSHGLLLEEKVNFAKQVKSVLRKTQKLVCFFFQAEEMLPSPATKS